MHLFTKKPYNRNKNTGNVSFSKEEFATIMSLIEAGNKVGMRVQLDKGEIDVTITENHIMAAQLKYARRTGKSFVCMPYYA